ncbi:uncharacterized protein [Heterodontus francisci]|uniref:uncharacterized protein isoform X2 n=1 Tax=Heterodontus francisci TaxID=7792 RepID=UPI00355B64DF
MRFLPLCVIIVYFISLSGSLELEIFPSPLEVSVNEDALLKCKYSNPEPDLTHVAVRWVFESRTSRTDVYIFNGGQHLRKRNGAKIFDDALRKGNASLYLPNVQLNEEGNYTCIVFVTPHKEEKSSVMQVSVQPRVSMSAQEVTTANGTETILACDVKEFYPKQINISWLKVSNGKMEYISKDQSTEVLITNSDGTFSVSSKLRIEPTLEDRTKYRCVVKHKTILGNFTLDTDPVEEQIPIGPIVGGFAALLCAVCLGVCIWKKKCKGKTIPKEIEDDSDRSLLENVPDSERVLPKISDFKKPHEIINGEQTNLGWDVTVFNPEVVNIVTSLKRKDEQEVKRLFHWKIPARRLQGPKRVCAPLTNVPDLCKKDDSFSAEVPEFQRISEGHFHIPCTVTLCPDICKDDDAQLIIEVSQESAEEAQTNSTVLKVTAGKTIPKEIEDDSDRSLLENVPDSERVLPKISDFKKPHEIINGEQTNLGWDVTVFNPEVVNIVTSLKRKDEQEVKRLFHWKIPARRLQGPKRVCAPLTNVPDLCKKDDSFSAEVPEFQRTSEGHFHIPCTVTLCPDICKDDDAQLIIEVSQESAEEAQTNSTVLKVTAGKTIPKEIEDDSDRSLLENVPDSERVLPKISDFKKPHEIINGEQTNLGWDVTVFNPEVVNIVTSLKRKDEQEVKRLFHWKIPARRLQGPKRVCAPLTNVPDLCKKDDSFSAEVPEFQRTSEGHFHIPCTVTLCPDICKDDDAQLIIEVSQESAEEAQTNSTVLKVTAGKTIPKEIEDDSDRSLLENVPDSERVLPKISDFKKPHEIINGEQTNLGWDVTVFNPEVVNIVTSLKRKDEQEVKRLFHWKIPARRLQGPKRVCAPLTNVPDLCKKDDSFSAEVPEFQRTSEGHFHIPCTVTLCPDICKDDDAQLIIEVSQESAEEAQTNSTVLKVTAGKTIPKEIEDDSDRSLLENVPDSERVLPKISDFKKPHEIINGEQTNLGWDVTVFNPEVVNIVTSLKRKDEQEVKRLFHWKIPARRLQGPKRVCAPLTNVPDLCKKDDSFSAEVPEFQRTSEGHFHIPCTVTLCPDICKDDDAQLIIEVSQESAEEAQTNSTVLKVTAGKTIQKEIEDDSDRSLLENVPDSERVLPKISDFKKPHEIINGEQTNLGWDVTVFNPEVVNIVTSLKRKDEQEVKKLFHWKMPARRLQGPKRVCGPLTNVPDLCKKDDSFSAEVPEFQRTSEGHFHIPCTVTLCPDICKDDDAQLIIEVSQESAEEAQTNSTVLKVTAGKTIQKEIEDDSDRSLLENVPDSERVLPKISDFKKPHEIINGEQTNLGWDVTVFNPEVVNIVTSLKRKDEQEVKRLFHWKIPARRLQGPKRVCAPLTNVPDLCKKDDSFSAEVPEFQRTSEGHFHIPCTVTLCPDICKDDDAQLIIEVSQESAEKAQTNSTVLKVTAGKTIQKEIEDDSDRSLLENVPDSERGQTIPKETEDDSDRSLPEKVPDSERGQPKPKEIEDNSGRSFLEKFPDSERENPSQ